MTFDLTQLLGGIGLFLFAMTLLESSLQDLGSRSVTTFLRNQSDRPLRALAGGTLATAALQSSSVVSLMVLALVGAAIMPMQNALGVIFGANLGTTFTGWLVATLGFKLSIESLALPLVAAGALAIVTGRQTLEQWGRIVVGLGLLLLGLALMKDSVAALSDAFDIQRLENYSAWQFLLFGAAFAAVVQSSSATMMINLAALHAGMITLPSAAAIAIGADLGTTSTVLLGAVRGSGAKKQVALAHLIFNLVTDSIAFLLRGPLLALIAWTGLSDPLLSLVAFHSLFNLLGILLFLPVLRPFAALLQRLIPPDDSTVTRFIDDVDPAITDVAMLSLEKETARLLAKVITQNRTAFSPPLPAPAGPLPVPVERAPKSLQFEEGYAQIKSLEGAILAFASRVQNATTNREVADRIHHLLAAGRSAVHATKNLKDIRHNLTHFANAPQASLHLQNEQFRTLSMTFNEALAAIGSGAGKPISIEALASAWQLAQREHDRIHADIYAHIRDGDVTANDSSSLLNVNREILNANCAILIALRDFHLEPAEAETLEQLPARQ